MTTNTFTWNVQVDGVNLADIVPDGAATITYGRQDVMDQPTPTTASIELLTIDVAPSYIAQFPQFTLGQHGIQSGFSPDWVDTYLGDQVAVTLGAPVTIQADTPSGFKEVWVVTYNDGENLPRFVGTIAAIDWTPERITLTCADAGAELTRQRVTPTSWPAETDTARAARIWPGITADSGTASNITATAADAKETTRFDLLTTLAEETGGLLWTKRDGTVTFRPWTHPQPTSVYPLADYAVPISPLAMATEIGGLVNQWRVEYGADQETVVDDAASQAQFGLSQGTYSTQFTDQATVATFAADLLTETAEPRWMMPTCQVNLGMANDKDAAEMAALDLGDLVEVGQLLTGAPSLTYTAQVLGITETLSATEWTMDLHLAPGGSAITPNRRTR